MDICTCWCCFVHYEFTRKLKQGDKLGYGCWHDASFHFKNFSDETKACTWRVLICITFATFCWLSWGWHLWCLMISSLQTKMHCNADIVQFDCTLPPLIAAFLSDVFLSVFTKFRILSAWLKIQSIMIILIRQLVIEFHATMAYIYYLMRGIFLCL